MAEVCAIVNTQPIVPVSSDPDDPFTLSTLTILTHKTGERVDSFSYLNAKGMLRSKWKHVQILAEEFLIEWRTYLHSFQTRSKWQTEFKNMQVGDVILLKDSKCAVRR